MKAGISIWEDRISPVLDGCRQLLVLDIEDGAEVARECVELNETFPQLKARRIAELGLDVLICGAVSRQLAAMLTNSGISICGWVNGPFEEVFKMFLDGSIQTTEFAALPGLCGAGTGRFGHGRHGRGPRKWRND